MSSLECPICHENKSTGACCKGVNCTHSVCYECLGRAFQAGAPIWNCPLCRAVFNNMTNGLVDDGDRVDFSLDIHSRFNHSRFNTYPIDWYGSPLIEFIDSSRLDNIFWGFDLHITHSFDLGRVSEVNCFGSKICHGVVYSPRNAKKRKERIFKQYKRRRGNPARSNRCLFSMKDMKA
jgi:hypothetical protein